MYFVAQAPSLHTVSDKEPHAFLAQPENFGSFRLKVSAKVTFFKGSLLQFARDPGHLKVVSTVQSSRGSSPSFIGILTCQASNPKP